MVFHIREDWEAILSKIWLFVSPIYHPWVLVHITSFHFIIQLSSQISCCTCSYFVTLFHNYILLTPSSIHIFHAYPVTPKSSPLAHHLFFDNMFVKDPTEIKSDKGQEIQKYIQIGIYLCPSIMTEGRITIGGTAMFVMMRFSGFSAI